ncbi:MAG: hypothetical protein AAF992_17260 [Bacteroidota bacterium]
MMNKLYFFLFIVFLLLVSYVIPARWRFNLESGVVFGGYKNVRMPSDGGAFFVLMRLYA